MHSLDQIQFLKTISVLEKWDYIPRGTDLADSYCCHCSGHAIESRLSQPLVVADYFSRGWTTGCGRTQLCVSEKLQISLILERGKISFFP